MMNHARINVGLQGVGVAEAAYQHALAYAQQRVQSARFGGGREPVRIIEHLDIRRMLMTMKSTAEAVRAIAFLNAAAVDRAHADPAPEQRTDAQGLADLLTPITKAYATDMGAEMASLGIQIFGGMGFIEETGAAQYYRDARIAPIYEGTNGIQALDLVGRKLRQDGGQHWRALLQRLSEVLTSLEASAQLGASIAPLADGIDRLEECATWLAERLDETPDDAAAGATPFLRMFGVTLGAFLLAEQAIEAERRLDRGEAKLYFEGKMQSALFFATQILPTATALRGPIMAGASNMAMKRETGE
jgi:hypothetical protein